MRWNRRTSIARQDSRRTAESARLKLHDEIYRMEAKLATMALICQALYELLRDKVGLDDAMVEAKMQEIDMRDGRADGRITGQPTTCPKCNRPTHTRLRLCMYCGAPISGNHLVEKN